MKRLLIIGAGGHGKVIADIALKNGYTDINFIDDHVIGECMGFPIIGKTDEINNFSDGKTDFVIGIGDNSIRRTIAQRYAVNWVTLIHPSAKIAANVAIGAGTVVMANAVINVCSNVGKHCVINTSTIVEHDNYIEDYVHLSPKVALGGTVRIGEQTHMGIGATVMNNIEVCRDCIIGAGAVVVQDITESSIYIGVPAKKHKRNEKAVMLE